MNQNDKEHNPHLKNDNNQQESDDEMADLKETLVVPVVLPVWSIICAVVVGAFGFGINYQQLSALVEQSKKVDVIAERQAINTEKLNNLDRRVTELERKEK